MQAADRIITAAEMAEIDRLAQERFEIPGMLLMENAGQKAWSIVRAQLGAAEERVHPSRIAFVAGNGNNGGDALVMARQALIEGDHEVVIITLERDLKGAAGEQWRILHHLGARRLVWNEHPREASDALDEVAWIVDGIAGTGISGPLRDSVIPLVERINRSAARVAAVDVPSGLRDGFRPGELAVGADLTVVTGYLKAILFENHTRALAGEIRCVDPGFPPVLANDPEVVTTRIARMPRSPHHPVQLSPDFHKGNKGRVLIVGGSSGTSGAAVLSAEGAVAGGAGMVRALSSEQGVAAVLSRNPSIMASELPASPDAREASEARAWADVAVLGPGWTSLTDSRLAEWLRACGSARTALVLDAAALRTLALRGEAWEQIMTGSRPMVLTPHVGEWHALSGRDGLGVRESLEEFPERAGLTIVVKSAVTWVRHSTGEVDVLDGRAPALAVAGSGDVLSGIIAAALARVLAAGVDTGTGKPEALRDAVRWALACHVHAGRELTLEGRGPSAADIAARVAAGRESRHD
ncbi:MAG: NAD(P)H-hydrate dehydratase [Alkalispirochaeta sp.]